MKGFSLPARLFFCLFLFVFFLKVLALLSFHFFVRDFFGGGNDSDYYHAYAVGLEDTAANIWPVILRFFNDFGLYSRGGVTIFLTFLGVFIIPWQVANLSCVVSSPFRVAFFWASFLALSSYPTLAYLTTDMYRDVFMISIWLFGLFVFKLLSMHALSVEWLLLFVLGVLISYVLYLFRPYLGVGYGVALVFSSLYNFRRYPFWLSLMAIVGFLQLLYMVGLLDPILAYRSSFDDVQLAGSGLGISFDSSASFAFDFMKSLVFQVFGVYIYSVPSFFVFLVESIPFSFFLVYLVINRRFSNFFVDYLVVFFVVYSVIWVLGNDNLGTAVRLRVFSYISILIAFFVVYQNKLNSRTPIASDAGLIFMGH